MIVFQVMDILEHDKKLDPSLDEEKHLTAILDNKLAARNDKATEEYVKTIAIASYKMYSEKSKEMETIENESSLFTNQSPKETQ